MLDPVGAALNGPLPHAVGVVTLRLHPLGREYPLAAAQGRQLLKTAPHAAVEACQRRRAESGRIRFFLRLCRSHGVPARARETGRQTGWGFRSLF